MSAAHRLLAKNSGFNPLSVPWDHAYWAEGPRFLALGVADGGAVASLPDEVGSDDATQATAGFRPTYRASSANMGGQAIIEYDGVNDTHSTPVGTALAQPNEIVIVARIRTTATSVYITDNPTGGSNRPLIRSVGAGSAWSIFFGTNVQGGSPDTTKHFFRVVQDATDTLDIDGANILSGNAGAQTYEGVTFAPFQGAVNSALDLAFFGVSTTLLTAQQRSDLLAWARSHYGTA